MPNYCYNTTYFSHPDKSKIDALVAELDRGKEAQLFESLYPMPAELRNTESPNTNEEQASVLMEKYGFSDWYSWAVNEWGTKWDAGITSWEEDGGKILISFDTAWGPPIALYDRLTEEGWDIYSTYIEEGMGFVGEYSEGIDECYDYSDATSETIHDFVPVHLDEEYGIGDNLRMWEEENGDDETEVD